MRQEKKGGPMAIKKDNLYQHADIIIKRMVEKSGLSQTRFAEQILNVKGVNISRAKKTGQIPDRWFDVLQEKYGVSKNELLANLPPDKIAATIQPGAAAKQTDRDRLPTERITPLKIIVEWLNDAFDGEQGEYEAMFFHEDLMKRYPSFRTFVRRHKTSGGEFTDGKDQKEAC